MRPVPVYVASPAAAVHEQTADAAADPTHKALVVVLHPTLPATIHPPHSPVSKQRPVPAAQDPTAEASPTASLPEVALTEHQQ